MAPIMESITYLPQTTTQERLLTRLTTPSGHTMSGSRALYNAENAFPFAALPQGTSATRQLNRRRFQ